MRILVTGGSGFIGSHICDELLEQGHIVDVLDSGIAGVDFTPKLVLNKYKQDLMTFKGPGNNVDAVVHCAARADVSGNWNAIRGRNERQLLINSNILGTANLLEMCHDIPMVFLSTCAVYGDDTDCQEDRPCQATSPYAASKLAGEAMVQAYAFKSGKPWHVFRMGCVVGSRYHHGHVRDFAVQMQKKGNVLPLNDGYTKKSYVHVLDVAKAVSMALRGEIGSGIYNATSGVWSPRDTIRVIGAESITEWPVGKTHGWVGDPMATATGAKLRGMGWVPQHSIESGVRQAFEGLR